MRIALIGDIHGNRIALEAVVRDLRREGADRVLCLGDVAAHGPEPAACVDLVRSLGCPVVLGNTDAALGADGAPAREGADGARLRELYAWCATRLDEAQRRFLTDAPPTLRLGDLLCCHGSPKSFDDGILATTPDATLAGWLEAIDAETIACGHTHLALLRRFRGHTLVNPGSVGLPRRPDTPRVQRHAEYAILRMGPGGPGVEFRRVEFDVGAVRDAARAARMPHLDWWLRWWEG